MRRLSQSRLFLNSTRAENANYRNNYVRTNTQESTTENRQQSVDVESHSDGEDAVADTVASRSASILLTRSTSMPSMSPEHDGTATSLDPNAPPIDEMRLAASDTNLFFERAETPPPPYVECITDGGTTT